MSMCAAVITMPLITRATTDGPAAFKVDPAGAGGVPWTDESCREAAPCTSAAPWQRS
ncbi:hypothetical protein [Streptomyces sp. NPDC050564]|uniref:hypothetical protein n=1 Tax=Streptomyces sp. NPDC050564 TaxID=3365631 RepID=UPI0037AABB46